MIASRGHVVQSMGNAVRRRAGACTTVWRATLHFAVLTIALLSYGAVPSATNAQSEVEAQFEVFAAETSHCDLRGGALRRGDSAAFFSKVAASPAAVVLRAAACNVGKQVSLGLALPLRC